MADFTLLSDALKLVKPSATLVISAKAREMKQAGMDMISLSAGEPDFDTPDIVKQAGIKAIEDGHTKYTEVDGTADLKQEIIKKFSRDNEISYEQNEVTVGSGAKQVIFNALFATINVGDEVIIPTPYWVSYPDMVALFKGTPIIAETSPEHNLKITPDLLRSKISERTKWLILNSPSNPSGQIYSKQELLNLAGVLKEFPNVHIISDDIYEHLVYDDTKFHTIAEVAPFLQNRTLVVNGVSKAYSMTGWRIGFGGIKNPELIKSMKKVQSQSTTNPSSISQQASIEALKNGQDSIQKAKVLFQKRRDYMYDKLSSIEELSMSKPSGAFYILFSIQKLIGRSTPDGEKITNCLDFVNELLKVGVAAVHGEAFGIKNFVRISYATSDENLQKSAERIKKFIKDLS